MPVCYRMSEQQNLTESSIDRAFPFLAEKGHMISLVGGGGKTSLMYTLAETAREKGWRTLVTTTTHIRNPLGESGLPQGYENERFCIVQTKEELLQCWKKGKIAVAGRKTAGGKLKMPEEELLSRFIELSDIVFVEADGAKRRPCKVPASHEPVLLSQSDIVLGVLGLGALGKTIEESCFRIEEVCGLLEKEPEDTLTAQDVAVILASEQGTKKNVGKREYQIVLNQYDLCRDVREVEKIAELLREYGIGQVIVTSLAETERMEKLNHE